MLKNTVKCVLLTLCTLQIAYADDSLVIELSDETFKTNLSDLKNVLVLFYSPSCPHCQELQPEFKNAADDLRRNEPVIYLAKIDCTTEGTETCSDAEISAYPTLRVYRNGVQVQDYTSSRRMAKDIVKFMKAEVGINSNELKSTQEIGRFASAQSEICVIALLKKEGPLREAYFNLPRELKHNMIFAHYNFKKNDKTGHDSIAIFRPKYLESKFEDNVTMYEGDGSDLHDFVVKNRYGVLGLRKSSNKDHFNMPLVTAYFHIDYVKNRKGIYYWRNRIIKVALKYKDHFTFAMSAISEFEDEFDSYGIDLVETAKPIIFAKMDSDEKYVMKEEFTVDAFDEFLQDLLAGNLEPHYKSEPIPEDDDSPLKTVVARNFKEVVLDNGKDTLIEFYATWCGHCNKLAPIYYELAEKLVGEDVVVAKMDAVANEVYPLFKVNGFPTIYFLPKDSKHLPIEFTKARELDVFIKFIAEHATYELEGYDREGNPKPLNNEL